MSNLDEFFAHFKFEGLTFDDVRTIPAHSEVPPNEVQLRTRITRNVELLIPFTSAAMPDVTEASFAIAMAENGGIGFIHRKLKPEIQQAEVRRVKSHIHGIEDQPEFVRDTDTIAEVQERIQREENEFHRFPVVDGGGKLVGVLDTKKFAFRNDQSLKIRDVMLAEVISAPQGTTLDKAYEIMCRHSKRILPLRDDNDQLAGMYIFSDIHRIKSSGPPTHNLDGQGHLRVGAAIGVGDEALQRLDLLAEVGLDVAVIDTSHGDSKAVFDILTEIKNTSCYSSIDIIAGNVATGEAAIALVELGADGIKVGIGPGSICTTRVVSGTGIPQVTAIRNVAQALKGTDVPVIADGGVRNPGDNVIAIAAGAHCTMMGKLFAGCKETPGNIHTLPNGVRVKHYRGMGSPALLGSADDRYAQQGFTKGNLVPEGIEALEPYKGELQVVLKDYIGGLRIGMGYAGVATIEELRTQTSFIRISSAGLTESRPHDVILAQDALQLQTER